MLMRAIVILMVGAGAAMAQGVAIVQMSDAEVDALREILLFDADGDGVAAMAEVAAGVSALVAAD